MDGITREFLAAVAAVVLISVAAAIVLERFQKSSDITTTTKGAVIHPKEEGIEARGR